MAKKSDISRVYSDGAITWNAEGCEPVTLDVSALSDAIKLQALYHGLGQKGSDAAAIPAKDLPKDKAKALKMKIDAIRAVIDRVQSGEWRKSAGDGSGNVAGIILLAFTEWAQTSAVARGKTPPTDEACKAVYDKKTKSEKFQLRNVAEIAEIMERIKSERGADKTATVDTDALLGELGV